MKYIVAPSLFYVISDVFPLKRWVLVSNKKRGMAFSSLGNYQDQHSDAHKFTTTRRGGADLTETTRSGLTL